MKFTTKKAVVSHMLHLIRKSDISLSNLYNFYIEHNCSGYILYTSKPEFQDDSKLINGLKFYIQHIRK